MDTCPGCSGRGWYMLCGYPGTEAAQTKTTCGVCHGSGKMLAVNKTACSTCNTLCERLVSLARENEHLRYDAARFAEEMDGETNIDDMMKKRDRQYEQAVTEPLRAQIKRLQDILHDVLTRLEAGHPWWRQMRKDCGPGEPDSMILMLQQELGLRRE